MPNNLATDVSPVRLGIGDAGIGLVFRGTADRPASLGDPDGFPLGRTRGVSAGILEEGLAVVNAVGTLILEIRVGVHAQPVNHVVDRTVSRIDPGGPGVNVADGLTRQTSATDGAAHILDGSRRW